jgi:glycosyltransferase involved in cell wall biosynthesis
VRIAYVLPYLETGGTEQHVLNLVRVLKERHEVVLAAPPGPLSERFAAEGIPQLAFPRFDQDLGAGLAAFHRVIADLRRQGTDLFHVHAAIELAFLARLWGARPLVYTVHGFFGPSARLDYRLAALLGNWVADRVICVSGIEREKLVRLGLRPEKAAVVWNGVPAPPAPDPAAVAAFRSRFGLPEGRLLLGALGRLEKQKGLEYLIEAVGRLKAQGGPDPVVVLMGDGREREALQARAAALGVTVVFTGFLGEKDRDAALDALDLYVMSSIGEALPLALIEAMGHGKAIVATTVGGIPEIIADGASGFLVAPGDPDALADRLARLFADPALRETLGRTAHAFFAQELTHAAMAEKTERLYGKCVRS